MGFSLDDPWELERQLLVHASVGQLSRIARSPFGTKYVINGPLDCSNGRTVAVRSVWIVDKGTIAPRLVTAYPQ